MVIFESPYRPSRDVILFSEPLICTRLVRLANGSRLLTLFLSKQTYSSMVKFSMPSREVIQLLDRYSTRILVKSARKVTR